MLWRPVSKAQRTGGNLMGCSRLVTHPDWQGLGLAFVLIDAVAAAYKAIDRRTHTYPAHPALIRSFDRSALWQMVARPGFAVSQRGGTDRGKRAPTERERRLAAARESQAEGLPARKRVPRGATSTDRGPRPGAPGVAADGGWQGDRWAMGSRPCATFNYIGPAMERSDALRLLAPYLK
jgi:hypothetical protein